MLKIAVAAVFMYVFTGCIDTRVCPRCLLPKNTEQAIISTSGAVQQQLPTICELENKQNNAGGERIISKVVVSYADVILYVIISISAVLVVKYTGKPTGLLSYICSKLYDKCSIGKRKIITMINAIIWRKK